MSALRRLSDTTVAATHAAAGRSDRGWNTGLEATIRRLPDGGVSWPKRRLVPLTTLQCSFGFYRSSVGPFGQAR